MLQGLCYNINLCNLGPIYLGHEIRPWQSEVNHSEDDGHDGRSTKTSFPVQILSETIQGRESSNQGVNIAMKDFDPEAFPFFLLYNLQ